jgi:hypothetical protein
VNGQLDVREVIATRIIDLARNGIIDAKALSERVIAETKSLQSLWSQEAALTGGLARQQKSGQWASMWDSTDGVRQRALADDYHINAGAIVLPPKANEPSRE